MTPGRRILKGTALSSGIAIGASRVVSANQFNISNRRVSAKTAEKEIAALTSAVSATVAYLNKLQKSAQSKMGGPLAKIFAAQVLIADDSDFLDKVKTLIIEKRTTAAWAYNAMVQKSIAPLKDSADLHLRQTAQDIEGVAKKVLTFLIGAKLTADISFPPNSILIGKTFTPGEILATRTRKASGFVVGEGGKNSHMALIARSLMLPVVVLERNWASLPDSAELIVDGTAGEVIVNPTSEDTAEYTRRRRRLRPALVARIRKLDDLPVKTQDGKEITIGANLELPGPVDTILSEQKLPVGLYRTEFLYLQKDGFPDEMSQARYYLDIADCFAKSYVVLRTFDLGSDKVASDGLYPHEENPALGWRGIRCMLELPNVFKSQIKAILRASERKNLRILLPMISELGELEKAKKLIAQCMLDLRRQKVAFDPNIKLGVMIEVPSAALNIEQFLPHVDFISIGSNDLTQYTMSADRNNVRVSHLYNFLHPSVLTLIKMTVDSCLRYKKPVCLCGEAAGDYLAIPLFLGMGLTEFSMNPAKIFDVCRLIRKIDSGAARGLVATALNSPSAVSVSRKLQSYRNALEKK